MRKRKLIVTLAAGVLLSVCIFALWPREDRITRANYLRTLNAKTRAEVEEIMGPGTPVSYPGEPPGQVTLEWESDRGCLWVDFDASGKKVGGTGELFASPIEHSDDGLFDGLIRRAKRQWRKWFPPK
jgi:hypothetical protein